MQIIEWITRHWPILVVLGPLISAPVIVLLRSTTMGIIISSAVPIINLLIAPFSPSGPYSYALGDWIPPFGIEYVVDNINYTFIVFLNIILLLFCMNWRWIENVLLASLDKEYGHIFFAVLALAHAGFTGILVTGDIFNAYVFIEISSLASYALIAMGGNKHSLVSSLEYLIIGTVSATLILIGIGMLFSITGTLNIKHIATILAENHSSKMCKMGIVLLLTGVLIKVAIFPLNFWMIKAYNAASNVILMYIAAASPIAGFYLLLRIIYTLLGWKIFISLEIDHILSLTGVCAILSFSWLALKSSKIKTLVLFSSAVQVGYICLMIANSQNTNQIIQYICADSIMKFILFYFLMHLEADKKNITTEELEGLGKKYPFFAAVIVISLISNMGLPITVGFFNKMNLLYATIQVEQWFSFIAVILTSVIGIEYNFKIIRNMYIGNAHQAITLAHNRHVSLSLATILSLVLIFYEKLPW